MTPSWYDVLGVTPEASADEIRTAWRASVDGLDPTDRRFRQRNRAAEVLLDPARRAAHDADLAADDVEDSDAAVLDGDVAAVDGPTVPRSAPVVETAAPVAAPAGATSGLFWFTALLGVLAAALVVATVVAAVHVHGNGTTSADDQTPVQTVPTSGTTTGVTPSPGASTDPAEATGDLPTESDVVDAVKAARTAIGPVLSYDYRHLPEDEKRAQSYMTDAYAATYTQYFSVVRTNAPGTRTIVTARVLQAGVARTSPGRVDVLLFVNRPTRNKQSVTVYHDQVTARMVDTQGTWLVDCLLTAKNDTCTPS